MRETITSVTERLTSEGRLPAVGVVAVVVILALTALFLFIALPDADAFDARVERLFVENADLTSQSEIKLLEILAQSGTAFSDTLRSYRVVIFVLLVSSVALLVASLAFIALLLTLSRRLASMEKEGIRVQSLRIDRETRTVRLNDMEFQLTEAALETLAALAEARMDGDILTGAELEGLISGRDASDCDEASGATRIKRLRDALGNQIVAQLLVKTFPRKGYALSIEPQVISIS